MDKLGEEARFDQSYNAKHRAISSLAMKLWWAVAFLGFRVVWLGRCQVTTNTGSRICVPYFTYICGCAIHQQVCLGEARVQYSPEVSLTSSLLEPRAPSWWSFLRAQGILQRISPCCLLRRWKFYQTLFKAPQQNILTGCFPCGLEHRVTNLACCDLTL